MLTTLMARLRDGASISGLQIVEISSQRRRDIVKQLAWLHERYPRQLPKSAFKHEFDLGDEISHAVTNLTSLAIIKHCGEVDFVAVEFP